MNPGTYYLYEYDNSKRRRNVGFIKVTRHYQSCILQIHAKGIPAGNTSPLELVAFYHDQGYLTGTAVADLNCTGRTISVRLSVSETHFPESRPLSQIDGFLIRPPKEWLRLFWMASAFFFEVNADMLRMPETADSQTDADMQDATKTQPDTDMLDAPETQPVADTQDATETQPDADMQDTQPDTQDAPDTQPDADMLDAPDTRSDTDTQDSEITRPEADKKTAELSLESAESSELPRVKKIQRSDLSILPRKFWHLANNSFLLHGCRNYGHLLLIEENERLWLGVPGIYDPHEARAADLFGFPRFTRSYAAAADLSENERNDSSDFGHWYRCVGPCGSVENLRTQQGKKFI